MLSTEQRELGETIQARVTRRLTWILAVSMLVSMMDRNNINLAALTMSSAIGLSATALGGGLSLFFVAYLISATPSNLLLARFGARRWLASIMASWGLVCALSGFVWNPASFYVVRFLLGVAEAGFVPGVLLYLTFWVTPDRRGRMNSYFLMAIPVSGVLTALVSGWILRWDGFLGLAGWQLIFVIEALPAIVLSLVIVWYLDDKPADAAWLTPAQRRALTDALAAETADLKPATISDTRRPASLGVLLRRGMMWVLLVSYFGLNFGLAAIVWVPQILQLYKLSAVEVSMLSAVPSAAAVIIMFILARSSDRVQERRWHYFTAASLCTVGYAMASMSLTHLGLALVGLMLAAGGAFAALVIFWTIPPRYLRPQELPLGMGLMTTIGVIGGMVSPILTGHLKDATGNYSAALAVAALFPLLGAILLVSGLRPSQNADLVAAEGG